MLRPRSTSSPGGPKHSYDPRTYTGPTESEGDPDLDPGRIVFRGAVTSIAAIRRMSTSKVKEDFSLDVMAHTHDTVESERALRHHISRRGTRVLDPSHVLSR